MAATKEAMVIILDIGGSMHEPKDTKSVFESAMTCINMIVQRKIFSESKDEIAIVLLGSSDTVNKLADEGDFNFQNISVIQYFKPADWDMLQLVNKTFSEDVVNTDDKKEQALVVAVEMLQNIMNAKKFFSRRILFISRFENAYFGESINKVCEDIKTAKIDLNIIGPTSFQNEEINYGTCLQSYPNCGIQSVLKEVNGESYSFDEAIPALIYYQKRKVQPLPWNANLDIGTNLTIPISAYTKVNENKPKSWKPAYARKTTAKLEKSTTYLMNDEEQTKVLADKIIPAFKYGTTLVPFTEDDKLNMDYQSGEKGIKVLGFTKAESVQRYHFIGDKSLYIFGQKNRELSGVILAPFIEALHETKMVAIVRYVYSARSAPKIGFLSPKIKPNYECLVFIALPFMEDMRHFIFAPLDADQRNLPTDDQLKAVDDLINAMDLSKAAVDEDGNLSEALKPKYTVNPYLQRLYQCLQHRALHGEKPLPEISPHIEAIVNPQSKLIKMADPTINTIKELFALKENFPKAAKTNDSNLYLKSESRKKRKLSVDAYPALSDAIEDKVVSIGSVNPVQNFQQLLKNQSVEFGEACKQIIDIVYQYLKTESSLKHYHIKILDICKELRHASIKKNEAAQYNLFMKNLKKELLPRDMELWNKIKTEKVGLLSNHEVKYSSVTTSEAESFFKNAPANDVKPKEEDLYEEMDDDEDLLDQL